MKLCFTNEKAISTWFERVQNPMQIGLKVYSANYRIHSDGHTLYSYGSHFPLVRWVPETGIFLTNCTERYSVSTSKHQSYVARHVPENHLEVGEAIRRNPFSDSEEYLKRYTRLIDSDLAHARRSRKYKQLYYGIVQRYIADRAHFIRAFNLNAPELPEDITAALVTLKLAA